MKNGDDRASGYPGQLVVRLKEARMFLGKMGIEQEGV
jgi:hypothetical protein